MHLIFLGNTKYGILREIKQPSPSHHVPVPGAHKPQPAHKGRCKTTCRSGSRTTPAKKQDKPLVPRKSRTLSENRSQQYGLPTPGTTTASGRSRRRSRQDIDYVSLNDGFDDEEVESPKCKK